MTRAQIIDLFDEAVQTASDVPENVPEDLESDACSRAMTWWEGQIRAALEIVLDDAEYEGRLSPSPAAPPRGPGAGQRPDLSAVDGRALDAALGLAFRVFSVHHNAADVAYVEGWTEVGDQESRWRCVLNGAEPIDEVALPAAVLAWAQGDPDVPRYSSDPAAALAVIEKMGEREYRCDFSYDCAWRATEVLWDALFYEDGNVDRDDEDCYTAASTFPRAVALAAARALHAAGQLPPEALALLS